MRAAANALALCAVLALTSLPARCQHDQAFTEADEAEPLCENSPVIYVWDNQGECVLYDSRLDKSSNKVSIAYGARVEVKCYGTDAKSLTISRNGKQLIPDLLSLHSNTIVWFTSKLDPPASEYIFTCTDIKNTCERSVMIMITPVFEVISPNVEICNDCIQKNYTVRYGNSMSVLCSGPDAARLVMTKDGKALPTKRTNATTVKSFERASDLQKSEYVCTDVETTYNSSVIIQVVPTIYFQSQNETTVFPKNCAQRLYNIEYSGSIEVSCSGPRAVKLISREQDGTILLTENDNKNKVFINITKLGLTEYICCDGECSDYVTKVIVSVKPRIEVVSPNASIVRDNYEYYDAPRYTVTYEHSLEILCSGPDASRLTIHNYYDHINKGVEQTVNNSTIRYILKEPLWNNYATFTCTERGKTTHIGASVYVAVLPAVKEFHCVSYNLQFLNCTWTGITYQANYILSHIENGIFTRICEKPRSLLSLLKFCVWDDAVNYYELETLTFLLQSCTKVGCYNQTFHIDLVSIVKLAPPEGLRVIRTTLLGAVLHWDMDLLYFGGILFITLDFYGDLHYKVQYWYSGILEPRTVNSSLVKCTRWDCEIELNLPCPGQLYEVSIYRKLKRTVGELWSDPSSVSFYTDKEDGNTKNNNPKCHQGPVKNKDVMRYFVQKLREEMLPEIQPMKHEVRALQDKLDNVRKYAASTKERDGQ